MSAEQEAIELAGRGRLSHAALLRALEEFAPVTGRSPRDTERFLVRLAAFISKCRDESWATPVPLVRGGDGSEYARELDIRLDARVAAKRGA